jgi:type IV secretory pathway VirB10-like protein
VREHEVYVVGISKSAFEQARSGMENRAAQTHPRLRVQAAGGAAAAAAHAWQSAIRLSSEFLRDRRKVTIAGGVVGTVVLLLAALLLVGKPTAPKVDTAAAPPAIAAVKPEAVKPVPVERVAVERVAVKPEAVKPEAVPAASAAAATPRDADAKPEAKRTAPAKPQAPPGRLNLAIVPWGEIYVNGRSRGLSPPVKTMNLAPGRYRVEVRNTTFVPHKTVVQVKAGEQATVQHEFK